MHLKRKNKHKKSYTIGSRGSSLALIQSHWVKNELQKKFPDITFKVKVIKTKGDIEKSLIKLNKSNVGFFTKEIEKALIKKEIDIAVHSLKDLPAVQRKGLELGSFPKREVANDILVVKSKSSLDKNKSLKIGTSSPRRITQFMQNQPKAKLVPIRGNIPTRLMKLKKTSLDGIIIAEAAINRLKTKTKISCIYSRLSPLQMIPAACQGILGIQIRAGDASAKEIVKVINHKKTEIEATAERACLGALNAGCQTPIGIHAKLQKNLITITAGAFSLTNNAKVVKKVRGQSKNARSIGVSLAKKLLASGAKEIIKNAKKG